MTNLTTEEIAEIRRLIKLAYLKGENTVSYDPETGNSVTYMNWVNVPHMRTILAQQQEIERLRDQKHYYSVSYMGNTMGCFLCKDDAIAYSEKFGGVYTINEIEFSGESDE